MFVESEVAHVLEHVLKVIPADIASVMLINQLEEVAHRHVCLLHSLGQLIQDELFTSQVLDTILFELPYELTIVDASAAIRVK